MMKHFTIKFLALSFFCLYSNALSAQDYEIKASHQGGGLISVEARFIGVGAEPAAGADAFLDFTIDLRWPAAANLNMGNPNNTGGYGISKAGVETVDGTDEYQSYQLSTAPLFLPVTWTKDTWVEIFTIQSNSDGSTGETIVVGALGSNPGNPNIPNFNMSGLDFVPAISGAAVLPVELSAFSAQKMNKTSSEVSWSTASELNTDHFSLERSTDARNWNKVAKLNAAGTSFEKLDYLYFDKNIPLEIRQAGTIYYRLKTIDFDGSFEYSRVQLVEFQVEDSKLIAYPNPTPDFFNLESEEGIVSVEVYNNQGKQLSATQTSQVSLKDYPAGAYRVKVDTGSRIKYITVVKAD